MPKIFYIDSKIDGLIWKAEKATSGDSVVFNFKQVQFIRPEIVILLLIACESIYKKTSVIIEWIGLSDDLLAYLERVDMTKIAFISFKPLPKTAKWFRNKKESFKLMELTKITSPRQSADARKRTLEILSNWFPERIASGYCSKVAGLVNEIIDNSLEHSSFDNDAICYYILQTYKPQNAPIQVVIVLGDGGMGIRNHLKNVNPWIKERDTLAIKSALIDGISGRRNGTGGLGFKSVSKTLQEFGGSIAIRSGRGSILYSPKSGSSFITKEHNNNLPGTQTSFIL